MAVTKVINIKVNDGQLNSLENELNQVNKSFKKVDESAKKTSKSVDDVAGNGGAIAILDSLTGGLATRFKDALDASKLFNISLKGTRTALIATGIGAFVVALGLVVAYWDDIKNFITGSNVGLEKQLKTTKKLGDEQSRELEILDKQDNILKLQGKSQTQINKLKKQELKDVIAIRDEELLLAKERLQQLVDIEKGGGSALESFLKLGSNLFEAFARIVDGFFSKIGFNTDFGGAVDGLTSSVIDGIFGTKDDISEAKQRVIDLENVILDSKNRLAGIELEDRGDPLQQRETQEVSDSGLSSSQLAELETAKIVSDGVLEIKKNQADEEMILDKAVADAKIGIAMNTLGLIGQIAGEGSAIGKGVAVAEATISGIKGVQNAYTTAQASPITAVFPAFPLIQAGLAGAFSAIQIKKILSTNTSGKGSPSIGGGGGGSAAPSFNVVGTSGTNQLAESLGQDQEPIQAYVVGSNVTTQQALDRNIQETATIG